MAEMLASAAVRAAGEKLGGVLASVVADEFWSLWNLREDLGFLKETLESIQAGLKDAERQSMENNASVTLWLRRLKSAAYDIQDMLEEFTVTNPREEVGDGVEEDDDDNCFGKVSLFCSSLSSSHSNIAHKIKKMKTRLEGIENQQKLFGFNVGRDSHSHELAEITKRETISDMKESIVGREQEHDIIIRSLLTESGEDIAFIAIHGFGGMGKTTLARLAFNDQTAVKAFDQRVWVYVSMKYDLKHIGESILSQVDDENRRSCKDLESLKRCLKTVLRDKTVLIVLDDLWEEDEQELERLKGFLNFGTKECKVILTTRSGEIARKMKPVLAHKLEVLSDEECWLLFKQTAGEVADDMEQIGKEIVKKCKGVPLAIKSVGFIMQFKHGIAEWEAIRDSNIWKMEGGAPSSAKCVLPSLRLSFHHLPAHLKLCFAYCSIFPKGCEIDKDLLIQQWIAMGFIQSESTVGASSSMTLEVLGQEYIEVLVGMSFLQASGTPLSKLVDLSLHDLKMIHLPPLGQLPKLRSLRIWEMPNIRQVGRDFSGGSAPFPRLRRLQIWHMPNLEEWHTTQSTNDAEEHIFPVLEELDVHECPKLRFVPFLPPCTSQCIINDSDEVLLSWQHNELPSYHMPTSELDYRGASTGFTVLQYFNLLKSLQIRDIKLEMMSGWGESISRLTSLESLQMVRCTVGGEWFGFLTSLRSLDICDCSLPLDFARYLLHLTTLETLDLRFCWETIKVLSEGEVQALIRQIPNVNINWCGPVGSAIWKNGELTECCFVKIKKSKWLRKNYDDAGVWPTILPRWPKKLVDDDDEPEGDYSDSEDDDSEADDDDADFRTETEPVDDDGGGTEGKPMEDDHSGTGDEAGPSGTKR